MMGSEYDISKLPYFHGLLPREDVKIMLKNNGDFLLRKSEPAAGQSRHYIISVMEHQDWPEGLSHYVIRSENDKKYSVTESNSFNSVKELIEYYGTNKINVNVDTSTLYTPILRQFWELSHESITMTKTIGEGAFGEVRIGTLKSEQGIVNVAVKVAKLDRCTKEKIKEIMSEARIMRNFDHMNVVKCYGVAAGTEPLLVVMELVQGGGLDSYMAKNTINMEEKLSIIWQVAQGVEYIHKMKVLHRDIAARNCLYGNKMAKVSDFGLSRNGTFYRMNPKNMVPIRWLAPETLSSFVYSPSSDVYAFGILCWEVLENGQQPYPGMTVAEVHTKVLKENYRMSLPLNTPSYLLGVIMSCWAEKSEERPTMSGVVSILRKYVNKNTDLSVSNTISSISSNISCTSTTNVPGAKRRRHRRCRDPLRRASKQNTRSTFLGRPTTMQITQTNTTMAQKVKPKKK